MPASKYLKAAESWLVPTGLMWPKESFDCSLWRKDFSITGLEHNLLWPLSTCSVAKARSVMVRRYGEERWAVGQAAWLRFSALPLSTCAVSIEILDYQAPFFFFYNVAVILDLPLGGVRTQEAAVHTDLRRAPGSMVQLP